MSQIYKYECELLVLWNDVLGVVARCKKTKGRASITNKKRRRHELEIGILVGRTGITKIQI